MMDINKITKEDIVEWFEQQKEDCLKCPFDKECHIIKVMYKGLPLCYPITYCKRVEEEWGSIE